MCRTCGCSEGALPSLTNLQTGHSAPLDGQRGDRKFAETASERNAISHGDHHHDHDNGHSHDHDHDHDTSHGATSATLSGPRQQKLIRVEQDVLAKSHLLAERNRGWFAGRDILALNLISSPGAGKTTLLERTIQELPATIPVSVIEGDQATLNDAERIQATGCKVVQINTGSGCHLEADMVARGLQQLDPPLHSLLLIENVGNLVCPALFDLGERARVVVMSVTDGEDKPVKYPHAFRSSDVMILNKVDLLPHLRFDVDRCLDYARQVNPHLRIFQVSATRGDGFGEWLNWLCEQSQGQNPV